MKNITNLFLGHLNYKANVQIPQQQKPQLQALLVTLQNEILQIEKMVEIQQHAYSGNILENKTQQLMTTQECYKFDQQIYNVVNNIYKQLSDILQILQKQLKQDESGSIHDQLVAHFAVSDNLMQISLFVGINKCLQQKCTQILEKLKLMKQIRTNFYGENSGDRQAFTVQIEQENQNAVLQNEQKDEQMQEQKQAKQFWDQENLQQNNYLEEYKLAQQTYKTVQDIQQMQSVQAEKIQQQSEQINRILNLTEQSNTNSDKANMFLSRAKKNLRESTKTTVVLLVLSIAGLIFLDRCR